MRRLAIAALFAGALTDIQGAAYYVAVDVPTTLEGRTYLPSQIVRCDDVGCRIGEDLPEGIEVDAVHKMDGGDWLFSVESPWTIGGMTFDPLDVVRRSGNRFTRYFDGAAAGLPRGANLDALFLSGDDSGTLVFSLDVPALLGDLAVEPADLIEYLGERSFRLFFDASDAAVPVPAGSDVIAADVRHSMLILSFDVATTLAGTTFVPGDVVSWDGRRYALYARVPAWPAGSVPNALALLANPGEIANSLRAARSVAAPGLIRLSWDASCSSGAEDYGVYEGTLGAWYSHTALECSDDGADLTETIRPGPGNHYYLVVPHNGNDEGSYGRDARGTERPRGTKTCALSQSVVPCP